MNMVKVITNLTDVMNIILKIDKGKEQLFPKQDSKDQKKKNGQKKMDNRLLAYKIPIVMTFLVRECYGSPKKQEF